MPSSVETRRQEKASGAPCATRASSPSRLRVKTLATGVNEQGRIYHIGGFHGYRWYNKQLDKIRSKRDRCKKKSRRYIHLSKVYKRVSERKRHKQRDGSRTKPPTSSRTNWLKELW